MIALTMCPEARSEVMRERFGDYVFGHLLNMARQEQIIFDNQTVTDWELARYFEREPMTTS